MTTCRQILTIRYAVRDAAAQRVFYREVLGMTTVRGGLGYDERQAALVFEEADVRGYSPSPTDLYWKVGIVVGNLDHAVADLRRRGVEVSDPTQFRDIGYLCHLRDPEGFTIELLQQGFEGNERAAEPGHAIGAQATLAHLTLRVAEIEPVAAFCEGPLGARLMSVQPVDDLGFTLCFYSWSDEHPPDPDLEAVGNREWLWARPTTLLELQHLEREAQATPPSERSAGFRGFDLGGPRLTTSIRANDVPSSIG